MLEREAQEITRIGNWFQIRHSEVGKAPIQREDDIDYLFHRGFALIRFLLAATGRREEAPPLTDLKGSLRHFPPSARRDLRRVLTSPSRVRADVIRQFCNRPGGQDMAELLMLCEDDDCKRAVLIEALRGLEGQR